MLVFQFLQPGSQARGDSTWASVRRPGELCRVAFGPAILRSSGRVVAALCQGECRHRRVQRELAVIAPVISAARSARAGHLLRTAATLLRAS